MKRKYDTGNFFYDVILLVGQPNRRGLIHQVQAMTNRINSTSV